MNASHNILAHDASNSVVILRGWPVQLTKDQLRAYTNWSVAHIDELTRSGKIKARRTGKAGALMWLRASVDAFVESEFEEFNIDDHF